MRFTDFDNAVFEGIKLDQSHERARLNHATVLLAWFCSPQNKSTSGVELGSGSAAVSIYLAKRFSVKMTAVEIDETMSRIASNNVLMNSLTRRVSVLTCDAADVKKKLLAGSCDFVVSNPPHYLHEGLRSADPSRDRWRRADTSTVRSFLSACDWLLRTRGSFFFVLHPRDLMKWTEAFSDWQLGIHLMRFVHGSSDTQAQLVLLSGRKGSSSEVVVGSPIILKKG